MRFGILYEHQLPRPWGADAEQRLLGEALDQVEVADRAGFDAVWAAEHHFLEEYAHSSAPGVFLAAASQRTKDIRLGFGVLPLPPGYQHPARVAETAATLDLISGGRVELGTGETSPGAELGGFAVDRATKREQWAEALDVVARMMVEEPFAGVDGRFVAMPARNVVPKPLQKPHPPLWVACSRRETIRLAARKGVGALSFSFVEPEEAKAWVDEYYAIVASEQCVPAGFAVNPNVAVVLPMMLAEDEAEAIERGIDGAHFFGYALAHYAVFGEHRPGRTSVWDEFLARRDEVGFARDVVTADGAPLAVRILQQGRGSLRGAIGTPEQVRDLLRRYEAAGVDEVIFCLQAGTNRHEHILESLELFAERVAPEFRERHAARANEKAARLRPAVARALERREPARTADPGYAFAPLDSGPPATAPAGGGAATTDGLRARLAGVAEEQGERAFAAFVRRSGDRRLERTLGTRPGLRLIFGAMAQRYRPDGGQGFTGELEYVLRGDAEQRFTLAIDGRRARVHAGAATAPNLTIGMATADFLRLAGGALDPGTALLTGRMSLEGDLSIVPRLGPMFGLAAV